MITTRAPDGANKLQKLGDVLRDTGETEETGDMGDGGHRRHRGHMGDREHRGHNVVIDVNVCC